MRRFLVSLLLASLCLTTSTLNARRQAPDPIYNAPGFASDRGYFSEVDFEHVDTLTGNLILSFTDLVLPGNAGMDLRFVRTFNLVGAWQFGIAGLPMRIEFPDGPMIFTQPPLYPRAITSDEAKHYMYPVGSNYYVTPEFWRYKVPEYTLEMPNGYVLTYERHNGSVQSMSPVYLKEVRDAHGNWLLLDWTSSGGSSPRLARVYQGPFGEVYRTISFEYQSASDTLPWKMTYDNRTWQYDPPMAPQTVTSPAGTKWRFAYGENDIKVTTPFGGEIRYDLGYHSFSRDTIFDQNGFPATVFNTRVVTARRLLPVRGVSQERVWTYDYETSTYDSKVTLPDGRRIEYAYGPLVGSSSDDPPFATQTGLYRRKLFDAVGNLVEEEKREYDARGVGVNEGSSVGAAGVLKKRSLWRSDHWFTTEHWYSNDRFGDYHQPDVSNEGGRGYSRTYRHEFPGHWIKGKMTSQLVNIGAPAAMVTRAYDDAGFMTSETRYGVTRTFGPDSTGNVAWTKDEHEHETSFTYDWGTVKNTTTPEYPITREIYPDGTVFKETRRQATTEYNYDGLGRVTLVKPPVGDWIATEYEPNGLWVKVSRGASWTRYSLDGFGRVVSSENSVGVKTSRDYDEYGRLKFESMPYYASAAVGTFFDYDAADRVTARTQSNGQQTGYAYSNGVDVTITEHNGTETRTTTQDWAPFGDPSDARLVGVVDAEGGSWGYEYNVLGRLTRVSQPGGPDRTWAYKQEANQRWMDVLDSDTQPESGTTTYVHNGSRLESKTVANGTVTIGFGYDGNDRVVSISAPGAGNTVTLGYDALDNRTLLQNGTVRSDFQFDGANRLEWRKDTISGEPDRKTEYTYWGSDEIKTLKYPSGTEVNYTYDTERRVVAVRRGDTAIASVLDYHPSGAIKVVRMANGIDETFTYDNHRYWLKTISGGPLGLTYDYDPVGNVKSIQDGRPGYNQTFSYDKLDRLTGIGGYGSNAFSYDALGNRLTKANPPHTYHYNAGTKRLENVTQSSDSPEFGPYLYEGARGAVGNLTGDRSGSYDYTPFNMLSKAIVGGVTTDYGYDGENNRTVRVRPTGKDLFYHVDGQLLSEFSRANGAASARWVRDSIYLGSRLVASFSPPLPTVDAVPATSDVREDAGTVSLSVRLTTPDGAPLQTAVSVNWSTENGTAAAGSDYTAASGLVTFPVGTASGTATAVQVGVLQDTLLEADTETFAVRLSAVQNARLGASTHTITIRDDEPKVEGSIDTPLNGSSRYPPFHIGGWAIDGRATANTGIDIISIGARPVSGGAEISLGTAAPGQRGDIATARGANFLMSGYGVNLQLNVLTPGVSYDLWVYVHFSRNNTWSYLPTATRVLIESSAAFALDQPNPVTTDQRFTVSGWAIDRAATSGTAIDAVEIISTRLPNGTPVNLGQATLGISRPEIAQAYGAQFANAGFNAVITGLTVGTYRLEVRAHSTLTGWHSRLREVTIQSRPTGWFEAPAAGATVSQPFLTGGWAADLAAASGSGISAVHIWAHPLSGGGTSTFLGAATMGARSDVASIYGQQFLNSGFTIASVTTLTPGQWRIDAHPWSTVTGAFLAPMSKTITVVPPPTNPVMWLDAPGNNTTTGQPFMVGGWAVDLAAPSGTGISTIHVWAHPLAGGSSVFLGVPGFGPRQDVANMYGQQFLNSGFGLSATGLTPGQWQVVAYAMSTQTGTFNQAMGATITIPTPNALVSMDVPAPNATVSQPFHIGGWAIDLASPNTVGISQMHVYAYSSSGQWIPLGQLPVQYPRYDVAAAYGAHYLNSAWGVNASGLAPGTYTLYAFPVSPAGVGLPGWVSRVVTVQ